jgi:predicted dehydrogenase
MSKKINIGVLGCANIAKTHLIPNLLNLNSHYSLVGVASRTEKKAKNFAEMFDTKCYFKYGDLLNIKNLDAVYIPLPNSLHYEWIKKSLNKGIHVLVEKSLSCSYKEVLELNDIAKEKRLVLIENFQFRFHKQLEYIVNILKTDKIGDLRNVKSSFGFPPFLDKDNIRYKNKLGGGALLDAGAYPIKISQIFLGSNISVLASSLMFDKDKGVDIWGSAYLKQNNGSLTSQISFGFDNYYQCNLEIWGSKGKLYTNRIFTANSEHKPIVEIETKDGLEIIELDTDNHFKNMLLHFYEQIFTKNMVDDEYKQNITQARLIGEFKSKLNEL